MRSFISLFRAMLHVGLPVGVARMSGAHRRHLSLWTMCAVHHPLIASVSRAPEIRMACFRLDVLAVLGAGTEADDRLRSAAVAVRLPMTWLGPSESLRDHVDFDRLSFE